MLGTLREIEIAYLPLHPKTTKSLRMSRHPSHHRRHQNKFFATWMDTGPTESGSVKTPLCVPVILNATVKSLVLWLILYCLFVMTIGIHQYSKVTAWFKLFLQCCKYPTHMSERKFNANNCSTVFHLRETGAYKELL